MTPPHTVLINAAVSFDWELTPGSRGSEAVEDLQRCIPADARDTIEFVLRTGSPGKSLTYMFPLLKPGATFTALVIMAHTAPVNAAAKPDPRHISGQFLSLGAKGALAFIQFEHAASAIKKSAKRIKYDLIILACCQGDKLFPLLRPAMKSDGVVAYFGGPDESPTDGVHLFLAQDMVEKALELIHACVASGEPLNAAELFYRVYTQLGYEYLGPSDQRRLDKDHNGEYLYAEYVLTSSSEAILKHPAYVKDYTLAGHLHGCAMDAGELVDDALKAKRAEFMAQAQRDINREHQKADSRVQVEEEGVAKRSTPSL